jgi:hypothetical protein
MFEEVSEAGATRALVEGADVIPEVYCDEWEAVVFVHDDDETVRHGELFILEFGDLEGLGWRERVGGVGNGRYSEAEGKREGERAFGEGQWSFHLFSRESWRGLGRVPAYSDRNGWEDDTKTIAVMTRDRRMFEVASRLGLAAA